MGSSTQESKNNKWSSHIKTRGRAARQLPPTFWGQRWIKVQRRQNKMAEEQVDVKYISLHGYIKNTPSDTEMQA